MSIVFNPSVQVQGLILLPFQRKMSGITLNTFSIFYFLICVMYNCSNCSRQKLFYQKILTQDLRNQQRDLIDFLFCYIAIISDKNTYHYNSKVLCRVTRVSNSLDKFVWLIGWLGIEKSGQIINHCHNAYQYHDEIRRISLKYMILSRNIKQYLNDFP